MFCWELTLIERKGVFVEIIVKAAILADLGDKVDITEEFCNYMLLFLTAPTDSGKGTSSTDGFNRPSKSQPRQSRS